MKTPQRAANELWTSFARLWTITYGMQQPMQPQQIQVVIQQQPMLQQPMVQQQVKHVELKGIPQNLQCPQCKKMVSVVTMLASMV